MYKFIVGGHWRHSHNLPVDKDQWGNTNNVIQIGNVATSSFNNPYTSHIKVDSQLLYTFSLNALKSFCSFSYSYEWVMYTLPGPHKHQGH
jgi:hypothetical protein